MKMSDKRKKISKEEEKLQQMSYPEQLNKFIADFSLRFNSQPGLIQIEKTVFDNMMVNDIFSISNGQFLFNDCPVECDNSLENRQIRMIAIHGASKSIELNFFRGRNE